LNLATIVQDGVLLLLLVLSIPFVILIVGAPLALVLRLVVELVHRM
jgi:hypothetical protein